MRRFIGVVAALFCLAYTVALMGFAVSRYYWPTPIPTLARGLSKHTHVAVRGRVLRAYLEADGDRHIWLRDSVAVDSLVAECIPKLPCLVPAAGQMVTVRGISRRDPEHGWYEVHPVEELLP